MNGVCVCACMCVCLYLYVICIEYLIKKYLWERKFIFIDSLLCTRHFIHYLIYILNNPVRLVDYIYL